MNLGYGIDLGSTCSTIARTDDQGQAGVLHNGDGNATTPSLVFCDPPHFVAGEAARLSTINDSQNVARFCKSQLGQGVRLSVQGRDYTPEFLAAILVRKMAQDAATVTDEPVRGAVFSVPVYFSKQQRETLRAVAQKAGIDTLGIIEDAVAAALFHGVSRRGPDRTLLVYDLGGSTFHASVLQVTQGTIHIVAAGGDLGLGARAWCERLIEHVAQGLRERFDHELGTEPDTMADMLLRVESARRRLSGRDKTSIIVGVPIKHEGTDLVQRMHPEKIELTRSELESLTSDLLARTKSACDAVLEKAGVEWHGVEVIAVGGGSWMPSVRRMLAEASGREVMSQNPDRSVALGCALHAARLSLQNPSANSIS